MGDVLTREATSENLDVGEGPVDVAHVGHHVKTGPSCCDDLAAMHIGLAGERGMTTGALEAEVEPEAA